MSAEVKRQNVGLQIPSFTETTFHKSEKSCAYIVKLVNDIQDVNSCFSLLLFVVVLSNCFPYVSRLTYKAAGTITY